jgi:hypothetical protein
MNILTTIYGKYKHPTQILVSNQQKYNLNDKRKKKKEKKGGEKRKKKLKSHEIRELGRITFVTAVC